MGGAGFGRWLLAGSAATFTLGAGASWAAGFSDHRDHVLGTSFDFVASTHNNDEGHAALNAALIEINRLDAVLSNWRSDSELAELNAANSFRASPDLFNVVARAEAVRWATDSHYSPRLGTVSEYWREAAGRNAQPARDELSRLSRGAAQANVTLDPATRTIGRGDAVRFDLDGAAKGYIVDRALGAARNAAPGAMGFMVDIGGDIATSGSAPDGGAWRVGVAAPLTADNAAPSQTLSLRGHAIAVSGPGARDLKIGAQAYAHLLAKDGRPSAENLQAAVISPTTEQADALATALAVMPARSGISLIEMMPGTAAQVIDARGQVHRSAAWSLFASADAMCQTTAAADATAWPPTYSMSVSFELPRMEGATKTYAAIWITDAQRNVVRTLMVIGPHAHWRDSNYVFWRRVERLDVAAVQAIARPSRAPGRYEVAWDGLDNQGRPVPQGQYTLNIEASREHGSHSLQTIPLDLAAAPMQGEGAAQAELGATRVRYGDAQ